jgi:hypothetical protein
MKSLKPFLTATIHKNTEKKQFNFSIFFNFLIDKINILRLFLKTSFTSHKLHNKHKLHNDAPKEK